MSRIHRGNSSTRRRVRSSVALAAIAVIAASISSCTPQSVLWAAGSGADRIATLGWFLIAVAGAVFVITVALMLVAAFRNRERPLDEIDLTPASTKLVSWGGAIIPGGILVLVFIVGLVIMGAFPNPTPANQLTIHVTAHQWWWQADYDYPVLQQRFVTANELHVPVGVPVQIILTSDDVIHSFWVPRLQGKLDVIPGDTNDLRILAKEPGVYRGQCAEFCGLQHAHMGLVVVADKPGDFKAWATNQLAPANTPTDSITAMGQRAFVSGPCALCHTVRGTPALGTVGPDLTHVASRSTIGAGLVPTTLASLEGWIANPQALKPGALVPPNTQFTGVELRALATYVSSLK